MSEKPQFNVVDPWSLINEVGSLDYFHPHPALPEENEVALPHRVIRGGPDTRLVLVLGTNASGKSFWRRLAQAVCSLTTPKIEVIRTSMEDRSPQSQLLPVARALIYGSEEWESTGGISAHTTHAGLNTCMNRSSSNIFILDEPDLGCGEEVALGIGQELATRIPLLPPTTRAVVITSHSRVLLRELVPLQPHLVWMGSDAGDSLEGWFTRAITPTSPDGLSSKGTETLRKVTRVREWRASEPRESGDSPVPDVA